MKMHKQFFKSIAITLYTLLNGRVICCCCWDIVLAYWAVPLMVTWCTFWQKAKTTAAIVWTALSSMWLFIENLLSLEYYNRCFIYKCRATQKLALQTPSKLVTISFSHHEAKTAERNLNKRVFDVDHVFFFFLCMSYI